MTQPLNDNELRRRVIEYVSGVQTGIMSHMKATDGITDLVHQYAQAYAESIIGEDLPLTNALNAAANGTKEHQRTLNNEKKGKL